MTASSNLACDAARSVRPGTHLSGAPSPPADGIELKTVLVIEDDQFVGSIYRNKLTFEGFKVDLARDGETGLQLIQSNPPHVVLLDLMLPKLTGVDVLRAMRSRPESKFIPVIVLSNSYSTNMIQQAWKAGATKCLLKLNCSPKQVIEAVHSVLCRSTPTTTPAPVVAEAADAPVVGHAGDPDAKFQADLRREFIETLPGTLVALRGQLQAIIRADNEKARIKQLQEFHRRVHSLTSNAGMAGLAKIAQMADALEALLQALHEKPANINSSTLRTLALGVDFLGHLFEHGCVPERQEVPAANILVVDDEPLARRTVAYALEKAKLKSISVEDASTALRLLSDNKFDLVFLDVDLPDMNGFELCTRLRRLPEHQTTPVIFVSSLTDFESRASSTISGGNDLIAKPFLLTELAVRALIHTLRGRAEAVRGALESQPAAEGCRLSMPEESRVRCG